MATLACTMTYPNDCGQVNMHEEVAKLENDEFTTLYKLSGRMQSGELSPDQVADILEAYENKHWFRSTLRMIFQ